MKRDEGRRRRRGKKREKMEDKVEGSEERMREEGGEEGRRRKRGWDRLGKIGQKKKGSKEGKRVCWKGVGKR